jgi:DNA-binding NarL/FixJ family response regulator
MLGEIALALSELDVAAEHLSDSGGLARACAAIYEGALTTSVEARLALAAGDPDRASRLFDEAAELAKTLNAQPLIERIEYERERSESDGEYPDALTSREVEVLRLITEGLTDAQIAESLSISPRTVMTHVSNILGKTGAPSRAAAAAYAVRRGLA